MARICLCCGRKLNEEAPLSWHEACLKRFFGASRFPEVDLSEALLDNLAEGIVADGHVVTGVQRKLSLTLSSPFRRKTIPCVGEYIVKTEDRERPFLPEYEFVGMHIATLCGFKTVPHGLLYSPKGEAIYICRRIDRDYGANGVKRIAMEDFAQLSLTQTEYKYSGSYERCAKEVIEKYSISPYLDKIDFFRMVFFSYILGNTDMHLKNFSLYKKGSGYVLTPFYDILPVLMVVNQTEMALTVHGKRSHLTKKDFLAFGENIGIDRELSKKLMALVVAKKDAMESFIEDSPLIEEKRKGLIALIEERLTPFMSTMDE